MHLPARRNRPLLAAAVLATFVLGSAAVPMGSGAVVVVMAADPSADVPGLPLPGPVAAGRLGGAIYDVVYNVTVPPGHVVVASLSGTPGTDFDMYLFDSTATTVLSTAGLIAKSTGPSSTEAISWASRSGGTYYIDLNGATDVEGDYRLTVQSLPDPTPPLLAVTLADGHPSTNQSVVPVTLGASDDLSGVAEMAFSPDGVTFGGWSPFQRSTTWTFTPGDGPKFLWVKVRNGVGLESAVAGASVVIDTIPPLVAAIDPPKGSTVVGLRPRLTVTFSESIDPTSWNDLGLIVQSASGARIAGDYSYDVMTRVGSFIPTPTLVPGATYVVTVGDVRDVAGNHVVPPGSWSVVPLTPTTMTATAKPSVLVSGKSTRIDISLSGAPLPANVEIESATGTAGFVPAASIPTDDGTNTLVVAPASNTTYRFRYPGAYGVAPSQADVRVVVRRSVVLVGRTSSIVARGRVGAPVTLTAAVGPAAAGSSVSFRLYRFDSERRAWVYAGSKGRSTNAAGRAVLSWVPPSPGSWYWRVVVAPTPEFANNTSSVYRWSISR